MKEDTLTNEQLKALIGQEVNRQHKKHRPLTVPALEEGCYKALKADDILYAFSDKEHVTIVIKDGKRYETTLTIKNIANLLEKEPSFKITHKNYIVNMAEVTRSHKHGRDYGLSFRDIPDIVPVTEANKKEIAEYLNINDLAVLDGYKKLMNIMSKNKIRDYDEDITTFDRERLYKEFSKSSEEINLTNLMYNLIYQAFTWIREGKMEPIEGNIRSFWYSHVKVALSTLDMVKEKNYDLMIQCFNKFITEWRITTYKSFGFWDANYYANKIGVKNPHIILMAEKTGHLFILEKLHREYSITTIALGGQGSSLSIEYFVDAMEEQEIDKKQTFYIFSSVDYDPAGYEIKRSFINSLKYEGIKDIKVFDIVTLDRFTPEEIQNKKYPLFDADEPPTKDWETRVKKWVRLTKGIGPKEAPWKDRAYGIEADAMIKKIRDVFLELAKPYFKKETTAGETGKKETLSMTEKKIMRFCKATVRRKKSKPSEPEKITETIDREFIKKDEEITLKLTPEQQEETLPLNEIIIPEQFLKTPPKRAKIEETIAYYKTHGKLEKPITVNRGTLTLTDGYKRYVTAKELGLTEVPVQFIGKEKKEPVTNIKKQTDEKPLPEKPVISEGEELYPLSKIIIPKAFQSPPKKETIEKSKAFYIKQNKFSSTMKVNRQNKHLMDNYKHYLAAKELGLTEVTVKFIEKAPQPQKPEKQKKEIKPIPNKEEIKLPPVRKEIKPALPVIEKNLKGEIIKLFSSQGYGFIKGEDGESYFFHNRGLKGIEIDNLDLYYQVIFDVIEGPKGQQAVNIKQNLKLH